VHVPFIIPEKKRVSTSVTVNSLRIPQAEDARYLGLHVDRKLNWKKHTPQAKTTWISIG
jgi:hypothetical protein